MYENKNKEVKILDFGSIDFKTCWDKQDQLFKGIIEQKIENRNQNESKPTANYLIFCEHPHVYTLGNSGSTENLLLTEKQLEEKSIAYYKINRGGDITYHGPGQLVMYPIFDLENFFTDIHRYLRSLEEAVINVCKSLGLNAERFDGYTGVWLDASKGSARKICAMGVKCSRWVTMHGIAFNVTTDLSYFENIIPCGIKDKAVTSLQSELGINSPSLDQVKALLQDEMQKIFEITALTQVSA